MIECLKVHEYICKKSSKLNHKWHFIILHRERKKNLDTYICEAHDSMVVCPEIAGFGHNVVA